MREFNEDKIFTPLWMEIENKQIKKSNELMEKLKKIGDELDKKSIEMFFYFQSWLLFQDVHLSTSGGNILFKIQKINNPPDIANLLKEEIKNKRQHIISYIEKNYPLTDDEIKKFRCLFASKNINKITSDVSKLISMGFIFSQDFCNRNNVSYKVYIKNIFNEDDVEKANRLEELFNNANNAVIDMLDEESKKYNLKICRAEKSKDEDRRGKLKKRNEEKNLLTQERRKLVLTMYTKHMLKNDQLSMLDV